MTSSLAVNLELENGQTRRLRLGATTQVRGLLEINNVIYPRFTGFHVEDPVGSRTVAPGDGVVLFPNLGAAQTFVSSDVGFSTTFGAFVLPYTGVYRVRLQAAYRVEPGSPGEIAGVELSIPPVATGDATITQIRQVGVTGQDVISFDQEVELPGNRILFARFSNIGEVPITVVSRLSSAQSSTDTFLDVRYIGAL